MTKYLLIGGTGFIGTNLAKRLGSDPSNEITVVGRTARHTQLSRILPSVNYVEEVISESTNFDRLLSGQNVVFHLISSSDPSNSNMSIPDELSDIRTSAMLFESCVSQKIDRLVFISSGGTVYGKESSCPFSEVENTLPISSYGLQKTTIEKLLYLYNHVYGLNYNIVRLSNPYGPFQSPIGSLGVVASFIYKALSEQPLLIYGDGSVVRDFIFIDDAIEAILRIIDNPSTHKLFNVGRGQGVSISELAELVRNTLSPNIPIVYLPGRNADVPKAWLDMKRFNETFGNLEYVSLEEGIMKTAEYIKGLD